MRFRFPLFAFLFIAGSFAIPHFVHAGIPFFGPIIDKNWIVSSSGIQCALGWGAFMTVINNIIQLLITLAIVFVAPLMIAWAGFLMVVNQGNAGKLTEARGILTNTIVGIVLALAGWMIVDAVMAVLYNPGGALGTWSSLISSTDLVCLPQQGVGTGLNPATTPPPGLGTGTVDVNIPLDGSAGPGCNTATVLAAAQAAGYNNFTSGQASALACISKFEDACGATGAVKNSQWGIDSGNGTASSAAGAYQLLLSSHHVCWDNSVCQQVAGASGSIDCSKAFVKGFPTGDQTILNQCLVRGANTNCAAAAAACTLRNTPSGSDWTSAGDNACKTKYL